MGPTPESGGQAPENEEANDAAFSLDNGLVRIRTLPGACDTAASFEILNEDHTLGNALRYVINKNPDVELCGYSIPHPSEAKLNLRIQTYDGVLVYDVLEKGLDDLMDLCNVVIDKFQAARTDFATRSAT